MAYMLHNVRENAHVSQCSFWHYCGCISFTGRQKCSIQACTGSGVFGSRRSDSMHAAVGVAWSMRTCPASQLQGTASHRLFVSVSSRERSHHVVVFPPARVLCSWFGSGARARWVRARSRESLAVRCLVVVLLQTQRGDYPTRILVILLVRVIPARPGCRSRYPSLARLAYPTSHCPC